MNTKRQMVILALSTWLGMVVSPILGWHAHISGDPLGLAEPFNPTNWLLFGIVTGFAVGSMFMPKGQPTTVITAHHGEGQPCYYCNYRNRDQSQCQCPDCVGDAYGEEYRMQVETHAMAPPHTHPSQANNCRICRGRGWSEEDIQPRLEHRL